MNNLEKHVNSIVLEEGLRKANVLAAQMGLESVTDEMLEMICPNLNYSGQFTPALFARFQSVKRLLKELAEQSSPKHGHIVKFANQYSSYDESALLFKDADIRKQNLIACVGGKTLDLGELELREFGLKMHIGCGGPFEPISESQIQALSEFDFYETTYRFWGQTPCGNGLIEITVPMKRWFLTV